MKKYFLLPLVLFSSCYTYYQLPNSVYLDKYIGKSEHDIVLQFGPATKYTTDGGTGKILEYLKNGDVVTVKGFYEDAVGHQYEVSRSNGQTYYLQFYISKSDSVYKYRSNEPGPITRKKIEKPKSPFLAPPLPFKKKT